MNPLTPIKKYRKKIAGLLIFLMFLGLLTDIFQTTTINAEEETTDDAVTTIEATTTSGIIHQASGSSYTEAGRKLSQTLSQSEIEKIRVIKGKITSDEWVTLLKYGIRRCLYTAGNLNRKIR